MTSITDNLRVIHGRLEPFSDFGSEGTIWCVYDNADRSMEGIRPIEPGDLLTVFTDAQCNDILWEGTVQLDFDTHKEPLSLAPHIQPQRLDRMSVHGVPVNIAIDQWLAMFREHKPCILVRHNRFEPL